MHNYDDWHTRPFLKYLHILFSIVAPKNPKTGEYDMRFVHPLFVTEWATGAVSFVKPPVVWPQPSTNPKTTSTQAEGADPNSIPFTDTVLYPVVAVDRLVRISNWMPMWGSQDVAFCMWQASDALNIGLPNSWGLEADQRPNPSTGKPANVDLHVNYSKLSTDPTNRSRPAVFALELLKETMLSSPVVSGHATPGRGMGGGGSGRPHSDGKA